MKIKKLAMLAGTMLMMAAFSLTALAGEDPGMKTINTNNQTQTVQDNATWALVVKKDMTYTVGKAGSFTAVQEIAVEENATLIIEGKVNFVNTDFYMKDNAKIIIRNGGSLSGTITGYVSINPSAQIIVDSATKGTFAVDNATLPSAVKTILKDNAAKQATAAATATATATVTVNGPMAVTLKKTSFTAKGSKAVKPAIKTVTVNGKKIAKKYYKVTYKNNKKAGKAQVVVTGKGKYKALRSVVNFVIKPAKEKFSKVKASKNTLTATWKKQKGVVGYEVQYSTNRKFTDAKSVYTDGYRATKKAVSGLTSKTKYYVRVRAAVLVDNKPVFGNWSSVKKVTVK